MFFKILSTRYDLPKNDPYNNSSSDWTLVNLNFAIEKHGIKLIYGQIDTIHADLCFKNMAITHSLY